jgi:hypothetical protein
MHIWPCGVPPCPTLLTILRAHAAKLRVLIVSGAQGAEGLMLATMTVLALPPMESCTGIQAPHVHMYTVCSHRGANITIDGPTRG